MEIEVHNPSGLPTVDYRKVAGLQGNLKDLTKENYKKLGRSIEKYGFIAPLAIWFDGETPTLIDGHQRLRLLLNEGAKPYELPYFEIKANTRQEAGEILLRYTSQYGTITQEGLDEFMATFELPETVLPELQFDALWFGQEEEPEQEVEEDDPPEVTEEVPVSEEGKVYQLGRHRVMCGDSTDSKTMTKLMDGKEADLVWIDPPYNVDYESSSGQKILNDKMQKDQFYSFLFDAFSRLQEVMREGAPIYIAHSDGEGENFRSAMTNSGLLFKQCIIWVKDKFVLGRQDYQWQHEPILYGWKAGSAHKWYGNYDKKTVIDDDVDVSKLKKSELLEIVRALKENTTIIREDKPKKSAEHPTMKPIKLIARFLWNSSRPEDIVVDSFLGSGSTLIACEQTDRTCYGLELDPKYVDVIRKRWAKYTAPDDQLPENWQELTPEVQDAKNS